jgi:hypothetical protein
VTFTDEQIRIEPHHETRRWQSCDYFVGQQHLFHERSFVRTRPPSRLPPTPAQLFWVSGGPDLGESTIQWFDGLGTYAEVNELARKHDGVAEPEFYPEDPENPAYFLAFNDTEKALAFCRTDDFDALCITVAKLAASPT